MRLNLEFRLFSGSIKVLRNRGLCSLRCVKFGQLVSSRNSQAEGRACSAYSPRHPPFRVLLKEGFSRYKST